MWTEKILFILEIIGTIAFSVSGAFVAIKARFDIFGVLVVGCITAVGGGITRDILIGATPPAIFAKSYMIWVAAITALVVFIVAYLCGKQFDVVREKIETVNNLFDSIGLAAFTVMGTELAFAQELSSNPFLSVTLGVLTGVGGGLLRDILTQSPPCIFKKYVYALVSIVGAILYYIVRGYTENTLLPSAIAAALIIAVRLLATKYHWGLPVVPLTEDEQSQTELVKPETQRLCEEIAVTTAEEKEINSKE